MRRCHHARIGRHSLLAACVLAALGGPVAAQPAGEFMTLDRGDHESRAGLFVGLLHLEDTDFDEGALRLEVHGQHVEPNGLGGYVAIPIHMVIGTEEGQDGATLAGVEVGGLLVRRLALGQELALRAGLVLPTAEGDEFDEFVVNFFAVQARLTDLVQAAPQTSTVRLGASWLGSLPGVIYRIDGGADVPLFTTLEGVELDRDPLLRLNGAVGIEFGPGTLAFELVNLLLTEGEGGDFGDRSFSNAGVSLGLAVATLRVQGGLFLSVDSALEDDQDEGLVTFAGGATTSW
jgi:hypothetical protein